MFKNQNFVISTKIVNFVSKKQNFVPKIQNSIQKKKNFVPKIENSAPKTKISFQKII